MRITPAYAGKTHAESPKSRGTEDHPPRMRGKLVKCCVSRPHERSPPAYAGKTKLVTDAGEKTMITPRVCGENRSQAIFRALRKGSPPQVRGKPRTRNADAIDERITPAGAGKTANP